MSIATSVHRRTTLRTAAAISLLPFLDRLPKAVAADPGLLRFGQPEPFSFDGLIEHARQLAAQLYVPPPAPAPEVVQQIDYDAHHKLAFKPEYGRGDKAVGSQPLSGAVTACASAHPHPCHHGSHADESAPALPGS